VTSLQLPYNQRAGSIIGAKVGAHAQDGDSGGASQRLAQFRLQLLTQYSHLFGCSSAVKQTFNVERSSDASSKVVELASTLRGHESTHWAQKMHRARSMVTSNFFSPTFVIVMALEGQSLAQILQPTHCASVASSSPRK
jgi:hypothetical protein